MAENKLSRKQREHLEHKQEILETALKLFSERGFHNVSMQEIAEESEFSVGTLYNFFESKESLFGALMKSCAHRVSEILMPILDAQADEREKVSNYVKAHKQIIEDHAPAIRLYLSQDIPLVLTVRHDVEPKTNAMRDEIRQKLSNIFKSGIRKGIFKDIDPWIAALSLSAMLESFVFAIIKNPEQMSIKDGISRIEEIFFNGNLKNSKT